MSATFDRFLEHVLDVHNERRQPEGERFVAMSATFNRGDFNLIRSVADKNNKNINFHWVETFNDWANSWGW